MLASVIGGGPGGSFLFFCGTPTLLDPLRHTLIALREAKHPALGPTVFYLIRLGARRHSAVTPILRIGLAGRLSPHLNRGSVREPEARHGGNLRQADGESRS